MQVRVASSVLCFLALVSQAAAFVTPGSKVGLPHPHPHPHPHPPTTPGSTELYDNTQEAPIWEIRNISYGEESRKYRRTLFTHDDWVEFRSSDRFWRNLLSIAQSGVYKSVTEDILAVTFVATFVCVFNALAGGYVDYNGVQHDPLIRSQEMGLPLAPFTLSSPSLGLLLVFRTNASYHRWDEARKNWGMNVNNARDLVRMGVVFYDKTGISSEKRQKDLNNLSLCTWAFVRAMKRHLSPNDDEDNFRRELFERLPAQQAQTILNAAHRPNRALFDLSVAIENLPMHFLRKDKIHSTVTIFEDNLGGNERLLTSPVPLVYSRHTARFLSIWLLLLPLALYEPFKATWNHTGMIPSSAAVSLFLFGIEELATQLEEPFTILPMQAYCNKIGNWCNEIVSWEVGDTEDDYVMLPPLPTSAEAANAAANSSVVAATMAIAEPSAEKVNGATETAEQPKAEEVNGAT